MLLWGGQAVSTLGTTASQIVYPLLILALTKSPTAAGLAGALYSVPYILLSLPVGALVDRWDRKRVMIICDLGRAATLATIPVAIALHALTLWQLYACALVEGTLFVLFNIAEAAALVRVVETDELPEAAAFNEAGWGIAGIVGPSFGTVMYQTFGRAIPFVADAVSYLVSAGSLLAIKTRFQEEREASPKSSVRADIAEGMRWLWDNRLIRFMALLVGGMNLVEAGARLLVIVLAQRIGARDAEIGIVFSIGGIGGIIGSLLAGRLQKRYSFGRIVILTTWGLALSFLMYAWTPNLFWIGAVTAFAQIVGPAFNVTQYSYRLALIPDALQGRVNSTFRLIAFGLQPIGLALTGVMIEHVGTLPTVLIFGSWLVVLSVITTFNRDVRNAGMPGRS